ncbi:IS200/IS605 family transposase [Geitlerinema sp. PCC 9228]|uniref:IS200/IS605 family transposase n=1 Tax=Geitlerinema sp. PCC 9228 TaxID=111611 RepID=UPI0009FCE2A7|nr:IS200/IS605 family transposase [Geitlerinema sp. PCC 9228]
MPFQNQQRTRLARSATHLLNYHFVWIPRRRKPVLRGAIANRCRELIWDAAKANDCQVVSLAIEPDRVHLFINCPLMKMPSMWTSSYFVSTADRVSCEVIQRYIEAQGKSS